MSADWRGYYEATAGRPPRRTALAALAAFSESGQAVDLGCGDGRDAVEMLRRGWDVLAIDAEPAAIARLEGRSDLPGSGTLNLRCARFEETKWPGVDLVNASFSLPLCPPSMFPALWRHICLSLKAGGRFAGQFYGMRDSWAGSPGMTHLRRDEVEALFADFTLELFEEEENDALTPRGKTKHWHIFHIVGRKRLNS